MRRRHLIMNWHEACAVALSSPDALDGLASFDRSPLTFHSNAHCPFHVALDTVPPLRRFARGLFFPARSYTSTMGRPFGVLVSVRVARDRCVWLAPHRPIAVNAARSITRLYRHAAMAERSIHTNPISQTEEKENRSRFARIE